MIHILSFINNILKTQEKFDLGFTKRTQLIFKVIFEL